MSKTKNITQSRLKELLCYDPATGLLTWLQRPANRIRIGDVAGTLDHGYIRITIDGERYYAHRLIFLYMVGWMPVEVDHDNQIRDDNRWENLTPANHHKNMKNQKLRSTNTSGYCGVYPEGEKWRAKIKVNYEIINLGLFTRKSDAIAARQAADIEHDFHVNHGNRVSHLPL